MMPVSVAFLDDIHPMIKAVVNMPQNWHIVFTASRSEGHRCDIRCFHIMRPRENCDSSI
jgi:hypothetical protein